MSFNLDADDEFEVFSGKVKSKKLGMGMNADIELGLPRQNLDTEIKTPNFEFGIRGVKTERRGRKKSFKPIKQGAKVIRSGKVIKKGAKVARGF